MPTATEFTRARAALGLSAYELGELLALGGSKKDQGDYVREIESGARACSGPIWQVVQALLAGWRPGCSSLPLQDLRTLTHALTGLQAESDAALARAKRETDTDEVWKFSGEAAGLARAVTVMTGQLARLIPG